MFKLSVLFLIGSSAFQYACGLRFLVTAPNTFRFGVEETVGIGIAEHTQPVFVNVNLNDYPGKKATFSSRIVNVAPGAPQIVKLKVNPGDIPELQRNDVYLYVCLTASANGISKEMIIPITKYSGYAMIQTDKPLYLPKQNVHIRVMRLTEKMTPSTESFTLQIKNPQGDIILHNADTLPNPSGITETIFGIPSVPLMGNWSVQVLYGYKLSAKSTVRFEVKEYVLPTFSVTIEPPDVILNTNTEIKGKIKASYVYGKPVDGFANINFAIRSPIGVMIPIGSGFRFLKLINGEVAFKIRVEQDIKAKVQLWFPQIEGSKLFIDAEVVERATGHRETAINDESLFTTSPYVLNLGNSLKDFKPRVPYDLQVEVLYSNKRLVTKPIMIEILNAVAYDARGNPRNLTNSMQRILATDRFGRLKFKFNTAENDQFLNITVATKDQKLSNENQAKSSIRISRYWSPKNSYVWISTPHEGTIFTVGTQFDTIINANPVADKLFYVIVSKGSIIKMDETTATGGAILSIQFPVTMDLVPSFRLVVFVIQDGHIISDSIKIDVEKSCKYNNGEDLTITAHTPSGFFNPGENVKFIIKGEYGSHVGITAVDEAVYILNKQDLLTKSKMFEEMERQDFGIGPGGGLRPAEVFKNAGLVMVTNGIIEDHTRTVALGQNMKRRKRSIHDKVAEYTGKAAICCKFGILHGPQNLTCERRAEIIEENIGERFNCSRAFLDCCLEAERKRWEFNQNARASLSGDDDYDPSMTDVDDFVNRMENDILKNIRHYFPETWISKTFTIGDSQCTEEYGSNTCVFAYVAPHSITTWEVQAFAISKTTGMCVADPLRVTVFKRTFLQLKLPPVAIRGEQIEVMATMFNYGQNDIEVSVYMFGVAGICMGAGPGERSQIKKIIVRGNNASSVTFLVMPLQVGEYDLQVLAATLAGSDAVKKKLKVLYEGVHTVKTTTLSLDPSGVRPDKRKKRSSDHGYSVRDNTDRQLKKQVVQVDIDLPTEGIPDTEKCYVQIIGDSMGQAVNVTLTNLEGFVQLPTGCVEQTASKLANLVYTMVYLRKSGKMTSNIEQNGYRNILQGYAHQITYKKDDGSFPLYRNDQSSIWLTAFVVKIFCHANFLVNINDNHMCQPLRWLASQQNSAGSFNEYVSTSYVGSGYLKGTVPLTAFVLISMLECKRCVSERQGTIDKAKLFLENNIPHHNAGHLAIVAYALGLAKSSKFTEAHNRLKTLAINNQDDDVRHWSISPPSKAHLGPWIYSSYSAASTIEITGYALLAHLLTDDLEYAHPVVRWLNNQRSVGGFFISTQDTVVALQALGAYNIKSKIPPIEMDCLVSSSVSARTKRKIHITEENSVVLHEVQMPANGVINLDANGTGVATVSVCLVYNAKQTNDGRNCDFDMVINATESTEIVRPVLPTPEHRDQNVLPASVIKSIFSSEVIRSQFGLENEPDNDVSNLDLDSDHHKKLNIITLKICTRFLNTRREATMSILDIGLFTGFKPIEDDLKNLTKHKNETDVDLYETTDRSVILYLSKVPNLLPKCVSFRTFKEFTVGKIQPATVKVYEYYEPSKSCTKFYAAGGESPLMQPICQGRQCFCLEGMCPSRTPLRAIRNIVADKERREELLNLICDSHDFAWKGILKSEIVQASYKLYAFEISHVLKAGRQKPVEVEGELVTFYAQLSCQYPILVVGNEYIIISNDKTPHIDEETEENVYQYWFDKDTRVYHNRKLKDIKDNKSLNLQKTVNFIFDRLAIQHKGCTH